MSAGLWYGADYNPEQWDAETVAEDIPLMIEAGVNLVTVGVFSWATIEPSPGVYHLDWLGDVVDRLFAAGIATDMATSTASPPPWFSVRYPESLPIDRDGRRLWHGSRGHWCPSSPEFQRTAAAVTTALAQRFAHHPGVSMWHVGNEYGGPAGCYCDRCAGRFRLWLMAKYEDLESLNAAWGTTIWSQTYSSWDQILPPRVSPDFPNPSQRLDWSRFRSELLLGLFIAERDIIKAVNPRAQIMTNFMGLFPKLDYWAWAAEEDLVTNDTYPDPNDAHGARTFAFDSDLMRSLACGKPFLQLEQATGAVQWRSTNTPKRPGQYRLWSLQTVARGADGICQFQWRQAPAGAEMFHSAMLPHSGPAGALWSEVLQLGADLAVLGEVAGNAVVSDVALVLDWNSLWARTWAVGPDDRAAEKELRRWHAAFFELGITVDFVRPGADLSRYSVVVLASQFLVSDNDARSFASFVDGGGCLIGTYLTGVVDDDLHARLGGYPGPLAEVFGVRVIQHVPLRSQLELRPDPGERISAAVGVASNIGSVSSESCGELDFGRWLEIVDPSSAEVDGCLTDGDYAGSAAVLKNTFGRGEAWYIAVSLQEGSLIQFVSFIAQRRGVRAPIKDLPAGVEVVVRGDAVFVLNHGDEARTVDGISGRDILSGRTVGQGAKLRVRARDAAVIRPIEVDEAASDAGA